MLHKFPSEIDHEALINHEIGHSLTQALLTGKPGSIELKADGNGYAEGLLPPGLTETQKALIGLHVSMAGTRDSFLSQAGLRGEWPNGCDEDVRQAMDCAHRLKACHLFSFAVSAKSLVHIAAAMSAYLVLKDFEYVSQAMRWRLSRKSWDTLWSSGQVEDFLVLQPHYVTHSPLLVGDGWVKRWHDWCDATTDWLDEVRDGPHHQQQAAGIYQRLAEQIAVRHQGGRA